MREAQFSDAEFAVLDSSRKESDALAQVEIEVMARVAQRIARGVDARYALDIHPDYLRLTDATYHGYKDRIMVAVERFERMVDARTSEEVGRLRAYNHRLLVSQISFLGLLLGLSVIAYLVAERGLSRPLASLMERTRRIAGGDYGQRVGRHAVVELDALGSTFNDMAGAIQSDIARREAAERAAQAAQRVAEAANQAKSNFLANMSHEIRTPLNAVIGMTEMLQETRLDAEQRDGLATISTSSAHLLGVINDILDFSKIEAGMICVETRSGCGRCWSTCCPTPSSSRRRARWWCASPRGRWRRAGTSSSSRCATPASVSRPNAWIACSSPSARSMPPRRATTAAPDSGSRSASGWPR